MSNFFTEISDFSWQHQKYARSEIYVVTYVLKQEVAMIIFGNKYASLQNCAENVYSCIEPICIFLCENKKSIHRTSLTAERYECCGAMIWVIIH